ncbi:hypothetical protein FACS1894122_02780 [Alphaproteobacteria bacterium]|nr:hypothetical protein FACS1894122_02780 [Alphaproteobacteria bacterium]
MKDDIVNLYMHGSCVFTCAILATIFVVSGAMALEIPINVKTGSAVALETGRIVNVSEPITLSGGWIYGYSKSQDPEKLEPWNVPVNEGEINPTLDLGENGRIDARTLLVRNVAQSTVYEVSNDISGINTNVVVKAMLGSQTIQDMEDLIAHDKIKALCVAPATVLANDANTVDLSVPSGTTVSQEQNALDGYVNEFLITKDDGQAEGDWATRKVMSTFKSADGQGAALSVRAFPKPTDNLAYTKLILTGDWQRYTGGKFIGNGYVEINASHSLPQSDIIIEGQGTLALKQQPADDITSEYTTGEGRNIFVAEGGNICNVEASEIKPTLTLGAKGRLIFGKPPAKVPSSGGATKEEGGSSDR